MRIGAFIYFILSVFVLTNCLGCDAFVRKFTRKKTKEKEIEVVFVPEEYPDNPFTPEQRYRQYFLFWKTWQRELADNIRGNVSRKRLIRCAEEALKNLNGMKEMLLEKKAAELGKAIEEMSSLRDELAADKYNSNASLNSARADSILRRVNRDFDFAEVRDQVK
ncbi:MAG: hypothetical protein PHR44_04255 [Candidatus Omnitrophica bacterium]|nr:hypothetical protein [Candidatus Omnitrophota bacterium]